MKKALLLFSLCAMTALGQSQGGQGVSGGGLKAPGFFPRSIYAGPYTSYFNDFLDSAQMTTQSIGSPSGNSCSTSTTFLDNTSPGNYSAIAGTGGTGTGEACVTAGAIFGMFNASTAPPWTWETRVIIPVLPGTTVGAYQAGLVHTNTVNPWTTGIGFYLSSANGVANDWYCRYGSTSTDSTIAAVVSTWTRLSLYDDGVNVHWYVNGVEATACKTAIASMPTTALLSSWTSVALSGTSVTMGLDYVTFQMNTVR